ncbi:MAG: hypothetical protein NWF06_03400 [Candidatus Bathyarchaeota archaeon]|nr:hypothetical protein [Candidatus Bathyarchaeum sp.]
MNGWSTKGFCLFTISLILVTATITPTAFMLVAPASAKPNVPYTLGDWTYVSKPVLPIKINESQIPIGSDWTYVYTLQEGIAYRVYCYGDWIDSSTQTNKTDYDIFVYDPAGNLESYHTEAAGLPEHLGTTVDHPYFIPKQSGDYSFRIINDPRESDGAQAATFMIIEHIETNTWYQRSMQGKIDDQPVEQTSWAYEFNTTSTNIQIKVQVPDTLDMYEARLYIMANPATQTGSILNEVPLAWEQGLYGNTTDIYGGYNLDSEGIRINDAMASCEYPGQDMLINFTAPVEGNLLYHIVVIAENGEGDINFIIKTDYDAPEVTVLNHVDKVNPNNATTILAHVQEQFNLETVTLNYTKDNGATYTAIEMIETTNSTYNATIPGQPAGTAVNYTVLARDISENTAKVQGTYWVKKTANITLDVSSPAVYYGENITITGSTPVGETNVTITYSITNSSTSNVTSLEYETTNNTMLNYTTNNSTITRTVTTDATGTFRDKYALNKTGTWLVWATWNGTETYFDATSDTKNFTIQKINLAISCNITSKSVTIGDNITVIGSVYPTAKNLTVNLTFSSANSTIKQTTQTNMNGTYRVSYKPDTMGLWHVHANITGNASISTTYSSVTTFTVNDTFLNQYMLYIIGGAGGCAGVSVVMFIKKRREYE